MTFKITTEPVTAEKARKAADQIEREIGEILNGKRKASGLDVGSISILVTAARQDFPHVEEPPIGTLSSLAVIQNMGELLVLHADKAQANIRIDRHYDPATGKCYATVDVWPARGSELFNAQLEATDPAKAVDDSAEWEPLK